MSLAESCEQSFSCYVPLASVAFGFPLGPRPILFQVLGYPGSVGWVLSDGVDLNWN